MRIEPKLQGSELQNAGAREAQGSGQEHAKKSTRSRRKQEEGNLKNGRLFLGNLQKNILRDPIEKKREEARAKAMSIVKNAFQIDKDMSDSIKEIEDGAKKAEEEMKEYQKEIKKNDARRKEIEEDEFLTKEEREEALKEIKDAEAYLVKQREDQRAIIDASEKAVGSILEASRKSAPMVGAMDQAEEVMKAADKEIVGMMFDEVKDKIDEDLEEKIEQAEKTKEEKKEEEEKLEKLRAEREEKEEKREEIDDMGDMMSENTLYMLRAQKIQNEVQTEVQNVAKQMKVALDDLKGAAVDEKV